MKWFLINNDSQQKVYELRTSKEKLLTLTHHPTSGTIRISTRDEKRVFLFGREGFIRNRTVLRNEYGIRMGQLSHEGGQISQGNIEISDEPFNYILQNADPVKAAIYKNGDILIVCELPEISKSYTNNDHDLLILTLCWYLAVAVKRQEEQYA